ncbi:MAG: M48 family metalloprotease, partial [Bdellovibrionales bacterium]|nr:M48 family metalloprotease [Bdellovibrionales bacterium]
RGCMNLLNRSELQGVIAHEFSHIIHGDMRLNIRLMGILHGILLIAMIGYSILRGSSRRRVYSSSSKSNDNKGGAIAFGLALLVIGYIGVFFGNLIKAAVSRQREFLADASAVQFTRDPSGISGALKKIGGFVRGSRLTNPKAEEVSHMLFAEGIRHFLGGLLATHPPLATRILRIDPTFKGEFQQITDEMAAQLTAQQEGTNTQSMGLHSGTNVSPQKEIAIDEDSFTQSIGTMKSEHLDYAQNLLASLPAVIYQGTHSPSGAQAIIYLLLFDRESTEVKKKQRDYLLHNLSQEIMTHLEKLEESTTQLSTSIRLPLIDLCLPTLKQLSQREYDKFQHHLKTLVQSDGAVSLFEYMLHHILERHVTRSTTPLSETKSSLTQQAHAAAEIISMLAYVGHHSETTQREAFSKGLTRLGVKGSHSHTPQEPSLDKLDSALRILWSADEGIKERTIRAAVATINSDGKVTEEEAEILRTVGDALGCPVPPLV